MVSIKQIPVFVYETLKKKKIQEESLGHSTPGTPASLRGWVEVHKATWPNIKRAEGSEVKGEILHVTARELRALDSWESRYKRKIVHTDKGAAWSYFYEGVNK